MSIPEAEKFEGRPLVLVADDETHIRLVVVSKLRSAGAEVVEARDGAEALARARERRPDLVITDLQMPHLSGLELAQALMIDARTSGVPVLMLTARGYSLSDDQMRGASILELMSKPFGARELLRRAVLLLKRSTSGASNLEAA
ncbi:MAG: response regulator [Phycisphaerales bacterium]|nr:response regulator [Phycisphaeraceae bacterium]